MATRPLPIRIAQAIGLTSCSLMTGTSLSVGFLFTPILLKAPSTVLIRQWSHLYHTMKVVAQTSMSLSSLSFFYLAYKIHNHELDGWFAGYVAAGLFNVAFVPYTIIAMANVNGKLLRKSEEVKGLKQTDEVVEVGLGEESAHQLVDWWGVLHLARSFMLTTSLGFGLWSVLN